MSIVIDANMKLFAERMNITSTRMIRDYGLSTIDEIIESEAEKGNTRAVKYAREFYHSPEKLIKYFELGNVENKFVILKKMDENTRIKLLPMLLNEELIMGLHFFTQEKLLNMLLKTDIEELVKVVMEAFPLQEIIMMFKEDDLAEFFQHDKLEKRDILEQLKSMPPEIFQNFIEGVTGMPYDEGNVNMLFQSFEKMPDDKFKKFISMIDPDIQRQVTFQLTKTKPDYLTLFKNESYVEMLNRLMKPEMIKPMVMLNHDTLVGMIAELPEELMSVVMTQIDAKDFAKFLQDGHMDLIEEALMI